MKRIEKFSRLESVLAATVCILFIALFLEHLFPDIALGESKTINYHNEISKEFVQIKNGSDILYISREPVSASEYCIFLKTYSKDSKFGMDELLRKDIACPPDTEHKPITSVTWIGAKEFTTFLSSEKYKIDLPTIEELSILFSSGDAIQSNPEWTSNACGVGASSVPVTSNRRVRMLFDKSNAPKGSILQSCDPVFFAEQGTSFRIKISFAQGE